MIKTFLQKSGCKRIEVEIDTLYIMSFDKKKLGNGMEAKGLTLSSSNGESNTAFGDNPISKD